MSNVKKTLVKQGKHQAYERRADGVLIADFVGWGLLYVNGEYEHEKHCPCLGCYNKKNHVGKTERIDYVKPTRERR